MSLFDPIPSLQLRRLYQYRGWMLFAPVYIGAINSPAPNVTTRNGVPEWVLDLAECIVMYLLASLYPDAGFPLRITGRLDGKPLADDPDLHAYEPDA